MLTVSRVQFLIIHIFVSQFEIVFTDTVVLRSRDLHAHGLIHVMRVFHRLTQGVWYIPEHAYTLRPCFLI